jgi:hypothetical protein
MVQGLMLLALVTMGEWTKTAARAYAGSLTPAPSPSFQTPGEDSIFLPLLISGTPGSRRPPASGENLRVNIPYFSGEIPLSETSIFWFGRVMNGENYADVRIAYTSQGLTLRISAFDRQVWYDEHPSPGDFSAWDAASLYLNLDGNTGSAPGGNAYRFDGQFSWWEERSEFQAAYRGDGSGWAAAGLPFSTDAGWRGRAPNANENGSERGWTLDYEIPFASLGLSGPPAEGTLWGMAVALHDRDDGGSAPLPGQTWPELVDFNRPASWGQLAFGLPVDAPPTAASPRTTIIRDRLNGAAVRDAAVGGTTGNLCRGDNDYIFDGLGNENYAGAKDFNIQNQIDVADWPCFSKYYVTFPLDAIPAGKVITSAALTLHLWGGSGGGEWGPAPRSLIQAFTAAGDWDEATLNWNNAPLAGENIARTWVEPFVGTIVWPGAAYSWDVRRALAEAHASGQPLRLVLYSADTDYHTGKYFTSSDAEDWNAKGRPTLTVTWGDP